MLHFGAFMLLQSSSHYKWHVDNFEIENIIHILEIIISSEKFDYWCKSLRADPCSWGSAPEILFITLDIKGSVKSLFIPTGV